MQKKDPLQAVVAMVGIFPVIPSIEIYTPIKVFQSPIMRHTSFGAKKKHFAHISARGIILPHSL